MIRTIACCRDCVVLWAYGHAVAGRTPREAFLNGFLRYALAVPGNPRVGVWRS